MSWSTSTNLLPIIKFWDFFKNQDKTCYKLLNLWLKFILNNQILWFFLKNHNETYYKVFSYVSPLFRKWEHEFYNMVTRFPQPVGIWFRTKNRSYLFCVTLNCTTIPKVILLLDFIFVSRAVINFINYAWLNDTTILMFHNNLMFILSFHHLMHKNRFSSGQSRTPVCKLRLQTIIMWE